MTNESPDSKAPSVGRALRGFFGFLLMAYVTPVYFRIPLRTSLSVVLLIIGLIGICSLIHVLISRRTIGFGPRLGALMAVGLLVVLCVLSWPTVAIVGRGEGALAVMTFLGMSLLIAAWQAAPGCELMAIPDLLFGRNAEMPCLIFLLWTGLNENCGASDFQNPGAALVVASILQP